MTAHAGFDTSQFPGLDVMATLKKTTNLDWCGYYLVAPSHLNAGWSGQRAQLKAQGWGLMPIYVGQELSGPGSHAVTAEQGGLDGTDAAEKMAAEGFGFGARVVLDLEDGAPFTWPRTDYVKAWVDAVDARDFTPAIYCSHGIAQAVADAMAQVDIWAFNVPTVAQTHSQSPFPTPDPSGCGYAPALAWQRQQNVWIPGQPLLNGAVPMLVDLSVALSADPSTP